MEGEFEYIGYYDEEDFELVDLSDDEGNVSEESSFEMVSSTNGEADDEVKVEEPEISLDNDDDEVKGEDGEDLFDPDDISDSDFSDSDDAFDPDDDPIADAIRVLDAQLDADPYDTYDMIWEPWGRPWSHARACTCERRANPKKRLWRVETRRISAAVAGRS